MGWTEIIGIATLLLLVIGGLEYWRPVGTEAKPVVEPNDNGVTVRLPEGHVSFQVTAKVDRLTIDGTPIPAPQKLFKPQIGHLGGENTQPVNIPLKNLYKGGELKHLLKARVLEATKGAHFTTQQSVCLDVVVTVSRSRWSRNLITKRIPYEMTAFSIGLGEKPATQYTDKDFSIELEMPHRKR